jgi:chemotaxis response regulator CheB
MGTSVKDSPQVREPALPFATSRTARRWGTCYRPDRGLGNKMVKRAGHVGRDIVVVGASAGGVEALSALFWDLPPELPIAFFVVLHVSPHSQSKLPSILERTGRLPAEHPRDGQRLEPGRVYVAPPNFHLLVGNGVVHLSQGPKEHHNRPAIDPLFRSAAQVYGQRVVGVLLSGMRDDGVAGLKEIKTQGGLVIVQDPREAEFPSMPRNALDKVDVDYCLPVTKIRDLVMRLADNSSMPMDQAHRPACSTHSVRNTAVSASTLTEPGV